MAKVTGLYELELDPTGKVTAPVLPVVPIFWILSEPVELVITNCDDEAPLMLLLVPAMIRLFDPSVTDPLVSVKVPFTVTLPPRFTPDVLLTVKLLNVAVAIVCAADPPNTTSPAV